MRKVEHCEWFDSILKFHKGGIFRSNTLKDLQEVRLGFVVAHGIVCCACNAILVPL